MSPTRSARVLWNRKAAVATATALVLLGGQAHACWDEAAERYNINPYVLQAIAKCESSLNPKAMNRSHIERTGTYDIGMMQINSSNLRALQAHGIGESELMDACTNINVGAWILAQKIQRYGNSWEAVGAYNAACSQLKGEACSAARDRYARCVYRNLPAELKTGRDTVGQGRGASVDEGDKHGDGQAQRSDAVSPKARKKAVATRASQAVPQLVAVKVMP